MMTMTIVVSRWDVRMVVIRIVLVVCVDLIYLISGAIAMVNVHASFVVGIWVGVLGVSVLRVIEPLPVPNRRGSFPM